MSVYRPIAWMTMGVDYLIWGMDPFGYHLTSLLFHCVNALLFYFVTLRLLRIAIPSASDCPTGLRLAAAFAAMLFALHPLRVEPVAWESGEDNLVAGFFCMLTLICYLRAVTIPKVGSSEWIWMGGAWLCYGLSIISKALTVPLPVALLVLDVYPLKRLKGNVRSWIEPHARRVLLEKIPFFLFAVPVAIIAVLAKQSTGGVATPTQIGWAPRVMQSFYGVAFYVWKTLAPWGLSPLYERPLPFNPWASPFLFSAAIVFGLTLGFVLARHVWPAGLPAWIFYVVVLLPSLGVITYGPQLVGDRYSYFSCLAWAALAGAGMLQIWKLWIIQRLTAAVFFSSIAVACAVLVGLGVLSWKQTQVWHDSETMWLRVLSLDPRSSIAHNNYGLVLGRRGVLNEAIAHLRKAVEIDPAFNAAFVNLGDFLAQRGSSREAISTLRHAIELDPDDANGHNTLGNVLAENGAVDEAIQHFHKALAIDPRSAMTRYNLARLLAKSGSVTAAIAEYRKALEIDPGDADIHNNLGLLFHSQGDLEQAVTEFHRALRANDKYAKAYFNLGKIYVQQSRLDDAVANFQQALQLQPEAPEIHEQLAKVLVLQGKKDEAAAHLETALKIVKQKSDASKKKQ
jgi:Tfp pilus assembly protein PilF